MTNIFLNNFDWILQYWAKFIFVEVLFSALLFLIVWPLSRILKKRSPHWLFGLWLLIYIRLIIPTGFSMDISVWKVADYFNYMLPGVNHLNTTEWFLEPESNDLHESENFWEKNAETTVPSWKLILGTLFILWTIGAIIQLRLYINRKIYFYGIIKSVKETKNLSLIRTGHFWKTNFRIKRKVIIIASDTFSIPFTMGIIKPKIFIPSSMIQNSHQPILNAAIAHEMAHIKRIDAFWLTVQNLINIFFFFNPIVWFASREINQAREQICDQLVLKSDQIEPANYASAILDTLRFNLSRFPALNFVPALITNKQIIQQRIKTIMENKKMNKKEAIIIVVFIFALALTVLPMSNILKASEPIISLDPLPEKTVAKDSPLQIPINEGVVSSAFGMRIHPILKVKKMHTGIDIAAPKGTNVYAAKSGKIIFADKDGAWGNRIIIVHDEGYRTFYGQLSEFLVKKDEEVQAGQLIGKVGSSGLSTAPHLHFEIRKNNLPIDPEELLDFSGLKRIKK
jgi:beta-lactamase regulating signal transducer with metallopeptidase domain